MAARSELSRTAQDLIAMAPRAKAPSARGGFSKTANRLIELAQAPTSEPPRRSAPWGTHPAVEPRVRETDTSPLLSEGVKAGIHAVAEAPERIRRGISGIPTPLGGPSGVQVEIGKRVVAGATGLAAGMVTAPAAVASGAIRHAEAGERPLGAVARSLVDLAISPARAIYEDLKALHEGPLAREALGRQFAEDPVGKVAPYAMAAGTALGTIRGAVRRGVEPRVIPEAARAVPTVESALEAAARARKVAPTAGPKAPLEPSPEAVRAEFEQVPEHARGLGGLTEEDIAIRQKKELRSEASRTARATMQEIGATAEEARKLTGKQVGEIATATGSERVRLADSILQEIRTGGTRPRVPKEALESDELLNSLKGELAYSEVARRIGKDAARDLKAQHPFLWRKKEGGAEHLDVLAERLTDEGILQRDPKRHPEDILLETLQTRASRRGLIERQYEDYVRNAPTLDQAVPSFVTERVRGPLPPEPGMFGRPVLSGTLRHSLNVKDLVGRLTPNSMDALRGAKAEGPTGPRSNEPIIYYQERSGRIGVLNGFHRLADAMKLGEDSIPARLATAEELAHVEKGLPLETMPKRPIGSPIAGALGATVTPSGVRPSRMVAPEGPPVSPHDVRRFLESRLSVPIRKGLQRGLGKRFAGVFKPRAEVIRVFRTDDLPTIAHEAGHYLDKVLGLRSIREQKTPGALAMRKELYAAGKRLYGERKPTAGYLAEGIAEFSSKLLTDPVAAKAEFPAYHAEFMRRVQETPDILEALQEARRMIERMEKQPAVAQAIARMRSRAERPPSQHLDRALEAAYDHLLPLKRIVEAMRQRNPRSTANAYDAAMLAKNWTALGDEILTERMVNALGDTIGPSMKAILDPVRGNFDDLRAYLYARVTQERVPLGKATGLTVPQAEAVLKELEAAPNFSRVKAAADGLYRLSDQLLDLAVEGDVLAPEARQAMRETYSAYAPLYRLVEDLDAGVQKGGGHGSLFKRARGSEAEIFDPLENYIKNVYSVAYRIRRNRVTLELLRQSRETAGAGRWVEEVPLPMEASKVSLQEAVRQMEKMGIEIGELPESAQRAVITAFRPSVFQALNKDLVVASEGGKPVAMLIRPESARQALLGMNLPEVPPWAQALGSIAATARAGHTWANLAFFPVNLLRDQFTAYLNSDYGFIPFVDPVLVIPQIARNSKLWQEYRLQGVQRSHLLAMDRDYAANALTRVMRGETVRGTNGRIRQLQGRAAAGIRSVNPFEAIRVANEYAESLTRFAEYVKARRAGRTVEQAARDAQEITVNFARVGAQMRALSRMSAFYNANLQGLARLGRTTREHPVRTASRVALGIAVPSAILYALNSMDEEYAKIPQHVRDLFWLVKVGDDRWVKIRKPDLAGVLVGSGIEHALDYYRRRDPEGFQRWAAQVVEEATPGTFGLPVPTALLPATEAVINRSLFTLRPLVPEHKTKMLPEMQAQPWTGPTARRIAETTGIPAAKVEHLVGGYLGGVGADVLRTADIAGRATGVYEKPPMGSERMAPEQPEFAPIARRFLYRLPPRSQESGYSDEAFRDYQRGETLVSSYRDLLRNGTHDELQRFREKHGEELNAYMAQRPMYLARFRRRPMKLSDVLRRRAISR